MLTCISIIVQPSTTTFPLLSPAALRRTSLRCAAKSPSQSVAARRVPALGRLRTKRVVVFSINLDVSASCRAQNRSEPNDKRSSRANVCCNVHPKLPETINGLSARDGSHLERRRRLEHCSMYVYTNLETNQFRRRLLAALAAVKLRLRACNYSVRMEWSG